MLRTLGLYLRPNPFYAPVLSAALWAAIVVPFL
jgi:hypothetical protein